MTLLDNLPNDELKVSLLHPCDNTIQIFIGREMPHRVIFCVNRLEKSSDTKSKIALKFRGRLLSLGMIKEVWLRDDDGFGATRKTKLTEDHFYKNAYSKMRVNLAVQVVLESRQ